MSSLRNSHSLYEDLLTTTCEPGPVLVFGIVPMDETQRMPAVVE